MISLYNTGVFIPFIEASPDRRSTPRTKNQPPRAAVLYTHTTIVTRAPTELHSLYISAEASYARAARKSLDVFLVCYVQKESRTKRKGIGGSVHMCL